MMQKTRRNFGGNPTISPVIEHRTYGKNRKKEAGQRIYGNRKRCNPKK